MNLDPSSRRIVRNDLVSQVDGRQSRRDRDPHFPLGARARHPDRGDLFARRPVRQPSLEGRRGLRGRQAGRADPQLFEHRRDRRAGQGQGCRRDSSRLRLPVGKRRICARLRAGRASRSWGRGPSCSTCWATRWPRASWRARRASRSSPAAMRRSCRARRPRRWPSRWATR